MVMLEPPPLARIVSSITTRRAYDGPWLSTNTEQLTGVFALIVVSGLHILVTCKSAESLTSAVSETVLLLVSGSTTAPLVTEALFVMLVGPPAADTVFA